MRSTARIATRVGYRIHALTLIYAAMLAGALAGCAAGPAPPPPQQVVIPTRVGQLKLCTGAPALPPPKLASNPNYLEYSVDVIDSSGAPTDALTQSDFVVTDNDRPIPIAYFRADQSRPPVAIAILVDKSSSMVTKLPVVSSSIDALMPRLDACDEVTLYAFGERPELVQDFTTDHPLVAERLKLVATWGKTPFYDGVQQGIALLDKSHYPDRAAIIFTDDIPTMFGGPSLDNASETATRKDIVSLATNSQRRFFVVGVGDPSASTGDISVAIGPFVLGGSPPDGVGAQDLKTFATDLQGAFFLIASKPDKSAPKVKVDSPPPGPSSPTPSYPPMAADRAELQQFATSLASQIDTHYTIGFISSGQPSPAPNQLVIKATRPTTRTTFHQITPRP